MNRQYSQDPIDMPPGSTLRIDDGAGVTLHVRSGEVWLTEEGGRVDHFLGTGQAFRISRDGTTLVQAFRYSVVRVSAVMQRYPAQGVGDALRSFCARTFGIRQ